MVLPEVDRMGVDVGTSAIEGPHPNIRAGCGSNYKYNGRFDPDTDRKAETSQE
jgi:hypothetical protein